MKLLWICGETPYPPESGLQVYSWGLASAAARAGADVRVLGLARPGGSDPTVVDGVDLRPVADDVRPRWQSVLHPLPAMCHAMGTTAFVERLATEIQAWWPDAVVIDHLQAGFAHDVATRHGVPVVFVTHNDEATVRAAVARDHRGSPKGIAFAIDARKVQRLEHRIVRAAALVTTITRADAEAFAPLRPGGIDEIEVLTPGYGGDRRPDRRVDASVPRQVAMVGHLDWHVRRTNLERFLDLADDRFVAAGITVRVIGGGASEAWRREIAERFRSVELTGFVDSIADELAACRVGLVSEPTGGGFKMRSLDYVMSGCPMAVLAGSIDGLPLEPGRDYAEFADDHAMVSGVIELVDDIDRLESMRANAFERCAAAFDWDDRGRAIVRAIEQAVTGP